jgi:aspartate racemase
MDFSEVMVKHWGDWEEIGKQLCGMAQNLERGGADLLGLCANTLHKFADEITSSVSLPLIHIADAVGTRLSQKKVTRAGLLGSSLTMNEGFVKDRLKQRYDIDVLVPNKFDQIRVHEIILNELTIGVLNESSKEILIDLVEWFSQNGAGAVILGCTEIPLLIKQDDVDVFLVDSTRVHAEAMVDAALSK